jgi:O-antigen/teichoic acid export membrane protein
MNERLSRGVIIITAGNVLPPVVGIVTGPILAHALGVDGRGEVGSATALLVLVVNGMTLGIPEAITYFVARAGNKSARRILNSGLLYLGLLGVLSMALMMLLSYPIAGDNPELRLLMALASAAVAPSLLLGGVRAWAIGRSAWMRVSLERTISAVTRLAMLAGLMIAGSLNGVTAMIVIGVTTFLGGLAYVPLRRGMSSTAAEHPRGLLTFGLAVWAGSLVGIALARIDQVLLVPLNGTAAAGIYVVAVTIAEIAPFANAAIREVLFSAQSSRLNGPQLEVATRFSTAITFTISVVLAAVSPVAVPVFFGTDFTDAVPIIWVLLLAAVLGTPASVASVSLMATGRPALRSATIASALLVDLCLLLIMVPTLGAMGAAIARLVGFSVQSMLVVALVKKFGIARWAQLFVYQPSDVVRVRNGALRLRRKFRRDRGM